MKFFEDIKLKRAIKKGKALLNSVYRTMNERFQKQYFPNGFEQIEKIVNAYSILTLSNTPYPNSEKTIYQYISIYMTIIDEYISNEKTNGELVLFIMDKYFSVIENTMIMKGIICYTIRNHVDSHYELSPAVLNEFPKQVAKMENSAVIGAGIFDYNENYSHLNYKEYFSYSFNQIMKIMLSSKFFANLQPYQTMELVTIMAVISDYACLKSRGDRVKMNEVWYNWASRIPGVDIKYCEERKQFYGQVIRGEITVRRDFSNGTVSNLPDGPVKCCLDVFFDVVLNIQMVFNYDSASVVLIGMLDSIEYQSSIVVPIFKILSIFCIGLWSNEDFESKKGEAKST